MSDITLTAAQTATLAGGGTLTITGTKAATAPTPPPPILVSANNTTVKAGGFIEDANGHSWGINASAQVTVDGTADTTTLNAVELAYVNGTIWQLNTSGDWYSKVKPSDNWGGPFSNPLPAATTGTTPKAKIMAALNKLRTAAAGGKKHIMGQTTEIWSNTRTGAGAVTLAMAPINEVKTATGKEVAGIAVIMNFGNYQTNGAYDLATGKACAQEYWAKKGLVQASLYMSIPTSNSTANGTVDGGDGSASKLGVPLDAADFHAVVTPGTAQYANMQKQIAVYVAEIKAWTQEGNVLVLRTMIEENGAWNWFGSQAAADAIALHKMIHDAVTKAGLADNIIWEFNANPWQALWSSYDPGAGYRDLMTFDPYSDSMGGITQGANADNMYPGMDAMNVPIGLAEYALATTYPANANTIDDSSLIAEIKQNLPDVVFSFNWCQGADIANQKNASALMNDPTVVTLADWVALVG